jgi:hypothetical protein
VNENLRYEISKFILFFFDRTDIEITPDMPLYKTFGTEDPDYFSDFLESFTDQFKVKMRKLKNVKKYIGALESESGFEFSNLSLYITRNPVLYISEITLEELFSIAKSGEWPKRYYVAYESID